MSVLPYLWLTYNICFILGPSWVFWFNSSEWSPWHFEEELAWLGVQVSEAGWNRGNITASTEETASESGQYWRNPSCWGYVSIVNHYCVTNVCILDIRLFWCCIIGYSHKAYVSEGARKGWTFPETVWGMHGLDLATMTLCNAYLLVSGGVEGKNPSN